MADELDQSTKEERAGCVHNAIAYHDVTDVPDSKGAPNVGLKGKCNLLRKEGVGNATRLPKNAVFDLAQRSVDKFFQTFI